MPEHGQVLVAILNNRLDFNVAREQRWYRIPVSSVDKWLKDRWPPQWLALYQTKVFGEDAHSINYYAPVKKIRTAYRWQLFPDQPRDEKSEKRYYQIIFGDLQRLTTPILSRRRRRIIFIPTTWQKFKGATEINTWHANPDKAAQDNVRDNDLETGGWKLLRFSTPQIKEEMAEYCIRAIVETVNNLGGVDEGGILSRKIDLNAREGTFQPGLFDNL